MTFKVYIGFDTREKIASDVCEFSIKKNSTIKVDVNLLVKNNLENHNILFRKDDKLSSTEFTFSRFLVPYLNNYKGWAVFSDCDFLWFADIKKLFECIDEQYAVMCVKHDYEPTTKIKMDGRKQLLYPRKNWSSMVLWNCNHPQNKRLDLEMVNNETGKYLHRFGWLDDKYIGEINYKWNWLVGWYEADEKTKPYAVHYTEGGPWFENYKNCEFSREWRNYKNEMILLNEKDHKKNY